MSRKYSAKEGVLLSVVVAVYREEKGVHELNSRLHKALSEITDAFEIIYVDDRSPDNSWLSLKTIQAQHPKVRIVRFVRNSGQHAALSAGIQLTRGEYVVLMDCDLQDPPEVIPKLFAAITLQPETYVVYVRRKGRKHNPIKRLSSRLFYTILRLLSGIPFDPEVGTFRIMHCKVADAYGELTEKNKFVAGIFSWMGFKEAYIDVEHAQRKYGVSTYSLRKLMRLAKLGILSSSIRLLSIGIYLGVICSGIAFLLGIYFIINYIVNDISIIGYSSLIVSLYFIGGLILLVLGIIGEYLGQTYLQVQNRPDFLIEKDISNWDTTS